MTSEGLNHYVRRAAVDVGILTGEPARAICGESLVPELRVGSDGRADDPALSICPACEDIYGGLEESNVEDREREAVNA